MSLIVWAKTFAARTTSVKTRFKYNVTTDRYIKKINIG